MKFIQRSSYTHEIDDVEKLGSVTLSSTLMNLNLVDGWHYAGWGRISEAPLLLFEVPDDTSQDSSRGILITLITHFHAASAHGVKNMF